jgi:phage-related protein
MQWDVQFYNQKVIKSIDEWPSGINAKFVRIVSMIENQGPSEIGMPYIKALKKGLFEIRAQGREGIGRAFFCIRKEYVVIILSGFIKKTQKTPPHEIDIARKRMEELTK